MAMDFPFLWMSLCTINCDQDTWLCVSSQERRATYKCVIYRIAKSPFSTLHISKTAKLISIKFIYFMPSIYTTLHTKFEENWISSTRYVFLKIAQFSSHFLSWQQFKTITLSQEKTSFSWMNFFQIWFILYNKVHSGLSSLKVWRCLSWIWGSYEWLYH